MIRAALLALALTLAMAAPARADPVTAFIGKIFADIAIGKLIAQFVISTGFSLLAQKLRGKPKQPGLQNRFKGRGGTEPETIILGRTAVLGHQVYHNSHGGNNRYYTDVLELAGMPGCSLLRVIIDGEYSDLGSLDGDRGLPIEAKDTALGAHRSWIKFYDGSQTTADAMLVDRYEDDPDRPWTDDHILTGKPYVVQTFDFDRKLFRRGVSEMRFEMMGQPVYDPRADSTVGGSGTQRWGTPTTWTQSENLVVLIYNIMRGITLPNGDVWGGGCDAEDLPIANWIAAMNACDVTVDGRTKYRGGIEIKLTEPPKDYIEELMAGCAAQISELGGVFYIQVDAPETPVVAVTDEDMSVSHPGQANPYPGLENTFNGITVTHPDPAALWNGRQALTINNADWEAEDGTRRVFDLSLAAVPYPEQAKQLANMFLNDNRRFRRHKRVLPPEYFFLNTLQTISWTSDHYGYDAKLFELAEVAYDLYTFNTYISLRERDPADFSPDLDLELPSAVPPTGALARPDAGVPGGAAAGVVLSQNGDLVFAAGVRFSWTAADIEELARGIAYQIRVPGADDPAYTGTFLDLSSGEGVVLTLRGSNYEWRVRALSDYRVTDWSDWQTVSTPGQRDPLSLDSLIFNPVFADGGDYGWLITHTPDEGMASEIIARADYTPDELPGRCPFEWMVKFQFGDAGNLFEYDISEDATVGTYPFAAVPEKPYLRWQNLIPVNPEEVHTVQLQYALEATPFSIASLILRAEFFDEDEVAITTTQEASVAQVAKPLNAGVWERTHWSFITPTDCAFVKLRLVTTQNAFGLLYLTNFRIRRALTTQDIASGSMTDGLRLAGANLVPSANNTAEAVLSGVLSMERLPKDNTGSELVPVTITATGFVNGTAASEYFIRVNGVNQIGISQPGAFNLSLSEQLQLATGTDHTIELTMETPDITSVELLSSRLIAEAKKR